MSTPTAALGNTMGSILIAEMEQEVVSARKCIERIPAEKFDWKPHEKSMAMGYLALLVAEIPKWIAHVIEKGEIDLATFPHFQGKTGADLAKQLRQVGGENSPKPPSFF